MSEYIKQYRRIVVKVLKWRHGVAWEVQEICRIWVDEVIDTPEQEQEIARQFGGEILRSLPVEQTWEYHNYCRTVEKTRDHRIASCS